MSENFKYWLFTYSKNGIIEKQMEITSHKEYIKEIENNSGYDLNIKLIYSD